MRGWYPTHRITNGQPVEEAKKDLSRQMRHAPTPSEALVWSLLRGRQVLGLKFRRQQVILGFIVDFFCAEERLVLEVDGSCHEPLAAQVQDEERSAVLARMDLRVLRIRNEELSKEKLEELLRDAIGRSNSPSPCRERGPGGGVIPEGEPPTLRERGPGGEVVQQEDLPRKLGAGAWGWGKSGEGAGG